MRIALVTPWPPQATGIADYAYDLASGLIAAGHDVCAITEVKEPVALNGVRFLAPADVTDDVVREYDSLVYQMGNNSNFHVYMIRMLVKYPGVVHLHDMVLHHIMAWILYSQSNQDLYAAVLNKWYGPRAVQLYAGFIRYMQSGIWDTSMVSDFPLFEEVLQHAQSCITHSKYAADKVAAIFPDLPIKTVPQLYRPETMKPLVFDDEAYHIGIFGGVDVNKRIDVALRAVADVISSGLDIHLHIAGAISSECAYVTSLIDEFGLGGKVHLHGRMPHDAFLALLHAVDLCIALRFPTMGETSAIVMRVLQAGVPVIVSDVGWYSELPSFIPKIKPGEVGELAKLTNIIRELARNDDAREMLRMEIREYGRTALSYSKTISEYVEFLAD